MNTKTKIFLCPNCKQSVLRECKSFPFCSERCKLLDLGAWASERYRAETTEQLPDQFSDPSSDTDQTTK